jgi:hypothetical protein
MFKNGGAGAIACCKICWKDKQECKSSPWMTKLTGGFFCFKTWESYFHMSVCIWHYTWSMTVYRCFTWWKTSYSCFLIRGFQMVCIQLFGCQLVRFLKQAPEATQTLTLNLTILVYPYSLLLILSIHFSVRKVSKVVTTWAAHMPWPTASFVFW